jgi:glycerol-3-phosphate dehydrogenase (NAD(P)+)
MVAGAVEDARFIVSVAKGLEAETMKRPSAVYEEELSDATVIAVGGPCLASELAQGGPSASVWASRDAEDARAAGSVLEDRRYQLQYTDDVVGVEYCTVVKNVAAIGLGFLDGLAKLADEHFRNAQAALFTKAVHELSTVVTAVGGRSETAQGLAGLGDILVTGLGGRNRLYGERVGEGADPALALRQMVEQGLTVEGVESTRAVHALAEEAGLELPYHQAVYRVLFEGRDPRHVMDVLC